MCDVGKILFGHTNVLNFKGMQSCRSADCWDEVNDSTFIDNGTAFIWYVKCY